MESIEVEVHVDQKVDVDVSIGDVIQAINGLDEPKRWNYLSLVLREISLHPSKLTESQLEIVINFLESQLALVKAAIK